MATSFQDDYIKTALRMPPELHAQLMEEARNKGTSFNSEVIARLRASIDMGDVMAWPEGSKKNLMVPVPIEKLEELIAKVNRMADDMERVIPVSPKTVAKFKAAVEPAKPAEPPPRRMNVGRKRS